MAARSGKPAEPGTEVKVSAVESDVADQDNAVAVEDAETVPAGDPRESALAALVYGNSQPEKPVTPETELVVDDSQVLDFGGEDRAVILFSYYNQLVDGLVRSARKGQVIKTDADSLARGIRISSLRKLEG